MQSSWRELQNTAGRASTAGPHPAQLCHGAGIRQEVSEALQQAGREEDAVGRAKSVITSEGHAVAAQVWQKGRLAPWAVVGSCLGNDSWGQPGEASHGHREKKPSHPLCHSNHTPSQGRALEEWYELHADPPYRLPQGNQYILTSNSHIPGGCYGWGGGGRTESKQQQQERS